MHGLKNQLSASRVVLQETQEKQQEQQLTYTQSLVAEQQQVDKLGSQVASLLALVASMKEQNQRSICQTERALASHDPECLYRARPPLLDAHDRIGVDWMLPGAHRLWQAWWSCKASGTPAAESFEWHMAQCVQRYFGDAFLVQLTGGSRDGGVDVWVQRRGEGGSAQQADGGILYECAVQVSRHQRPHSTLALSFICAPWLCRIDVQGVCVCRSRDIALSCRTLQCETFTTKWG